MHCILGSGILDECAGRTNQEAYRVSHAEARPKVLDCIHLFACLVGGTGRSARRTHDRSSLAIGFRCNSIGAEHLGETIMDRHRTLARVLKEKKDLSLNEFFLLKFARTNVPLTSRPSHDHFSCPAHSSNNK